MTACGGCKEPTNSTLQCPTCIKLKLPVIYFCSQECFRLNWSAHKSAHKKLPDNQLLGLSKIFGGYEFSGKLRPWPQTPMKRVPDDIPKPDYAETGIPYSEEAVRDSKEIPVNTASDIEVGFISVFNYSSKNLRKCCYIARKALDLAHSMAKPGVTTDAIDTAVHNFIISHKAYPSPLNYYKFPKSCCASVNEVICHGIPDLRPLQSGDLNETFLIGEVEQKTKELVETAYEAMMYSIAQCRPNVPYRQIGKIINKHVSSKGFSVVRAYTGHGVGALFHCMPYVPHYAKNKAIGIMKPGHVFTIEPMINEGDYSDTTWPDDWTAVTQDGKMSAQFEHTLLITESGVEILTARLPDSPPLEFNPKSEADFLNEFK